jgi:hypothetical protein
LQRLISNIQLETIYPKKGVGGVTQKYTPSLIRTFLSYVVVVWHQQLFVANSLQQQQQQQQQINYKNDNRGENDEWGLVQ